MNTYLLIFFFISKISSQIYSLFETPKEILSTSITLQKLESKKSYFEIMNYVYSDIYSPLIQVDLSIPSTISFSHSNLDFGIGYPNFLSLIYKEINYGNNKISITNSHNKNVFYPQRVKDNLVISSSNYENHNNESIVDCVFNNMYYEYQLNNMQGNKNYNKFEFFLQYTFGLYNGELYYMKEKLNKEKKFDISDCSGNINDFFIHSKLEKSIYEGYLYLYLSKEKKICVYSLFLESIGLRYEFINEILNIENNLLDIKNYGNYIYYSLEGKKVINQISINDTSRIINNYTYSDVSNDFISFVILDETIYAIEKNKGLLVFNKTNLSSIIKSFEFKYAVKLDFFINAYTGNKFLGLYLNNIDNEENEFFIEFILIKENNPLLNKVLLYPNSVKPSIDQILTFDYFFTYLYDKANKQIIIIKRGSLFHIPFVSFKIDLSKQNNNFNSHIFPIYMGKNNISIGILDNNHYLLINGRFVESKLTCNFEKTGLYTIVFLQNIDFCHVYSQIENQKGLFCRNLMAYRFNVLNNPKNNLKRNVIIIFSVLNVIFLIVIFCLIKYRKRLKEGKIYVKANFDKNNKLYLYLETNNINNKNNEKNQHIGEFDSKNLISKDNFGGINYDYSIEEILKKNKKREKEGYNTHKNKNENENDKNKDIQVSIIKNNFFGKNIEKIQVIRTFNNNIPQLDNNQNGTDNDNNINVNKYYNDIDVNGHNGNIN